MSVTLLPASSRKWESMPWGWIDTICNESDHCLRTLFVKGGQCTQMLRHANRDTTLVCDEGVVAVEYLVGTPRAALEYTTKLRTQMLSCGVAIHIPPNTWCRIVGIEDAYLWASSNYRDDTASEVFDFEGFTASQLPDVISPDEGV